ncbi:hypothetical protein LOTGIDRAFT_232118 [Lottia gigantea]|uniref:Eukaryotic translation initiation factor 2-alpha kinase 1 n=1 Tax=Lottia gigantea TaxID=225164 RepID=V4AJS2_LOTGI|nr:hypothetical protein LOTGIDRAFT_232118 [Lottia gigantea]ESO94965.1 hypothetical protein LOTGIDRAFT_232118 [Lottia gigantea]
MAQRKKSGKELGTQAKFKLKSGLKPIRKFDESDLYEVRSVEVPVKPAPLETGALVPRSVPSHLLMISILEHLCFMYTRNGNMAHKLFKVLCEQLTKLRVVSPLSCIDEMSGIRSHYRSSVHNMIQAAMNDLHEKGEILALPPTLEFGNMKLNHQLTRVRTEELISLQTSRYEHEFIELGKLGKGGFGSVYKVQNRLDGRNYAVKKIKFKHKKPEHLLKVLKEVKALANFQHTNIVGYNAAWLEYDFPSVNTSRSSSSLTDHDISQDKSFSNIQEDNGHSVDVEFHLDSGSEDELYEKQGKIIHKHYNQSICRITEITEIATAPAKQTLPSKTFEKPSEKSPKTILNSIIPSVQDLSFSVPSLPKIQEIQCMNSHKDHINIDNSDSSDIIFLDESNHPSNSTQSFNVARNHFLEVQNLTDDNLSDSESKSCELNIDDSNDEFKVVRKRVGHSHHITASTGAKTSGISIPYGKKENTTPNASPKDRLVPFRRSISAEPITNNKNIINDLQEYSDDNFPYHATITLYIQMELCEQTLQNWLYERNSKLNSIEDLKLYEEDNMRIIHQILTGVNYIHSLCLIHRDLKPRNIFLVGNNLHVKIGDFGLATENVIDSDTKDTILTPSPDIKAFFKYDDLTSGVGTYQYAAPEQLTNNQYDSKVSMLTLTVNQYAKKVSLLALTNNHYDSKVSMLALTNNQNDSKVSMLALTNNHYDSKVSMLALTNNQNDSKSDIYSIGVILFEEFQVFKTEMERHVSIKQLRDGIISESLQQNWPKEAQAIKEMTSVKPNDRPTAKYLLDSQLFLSPDQVIASLQKQLCEKSNYIIQLEKQLKEKNDENYELKRKLEQKLEQSAAEHFLFEAFH